MGTPSPGDVVATPAVVGVEAPDTAPLNVGVPGTAEAVPGAVTGDIDPTGHRGKWLEETQA